MADSSDSGSLTEASSSSGSSSSRSASAREQDCFLPIANITRLMKATLPEEAKVGRQAKECMQESVSEFISFITSEASDKCCTEKRKTINGDDILWAMQSLGFDNYLEPLKIYLQRYRNSERPPGAKRMAGGFPSQSEWTSESYHGISYGPPPPPGPQPPN